MMRRILSLVLIIAVLLSVVPVTAVATDNDKPTYVSLGASNVNGYGLRGYIKAINGMTVDETYEAAALDPSIKASANVLGYTAETPDSYPVLIADSLGYDLEQLAISSMRAEELRILLSDDYDGDSYSAWRFVGSGKWFEIATPGGMDALRTEYQSKIADAELVTIDVGANNFGVYISHQLTSNHRYDNDVALIDPAMAETYATAKEYVKELVAEVAPEYSNVILGMDELLDTMTYALVGFCVNFDKSLERIYELNPDVQVVAISIQNLMEGYQILLPGTDVVLPLGDIFGGLVNAANIYIATGSPYADRYLCADVRQNGRVECFLEDIIAYNGVPQSLEPEMRDCFDVLDGSPGNSYTRNLHVKYMLNAYTNGQYTNAMLYAAYDAVASILQEAAKVEVMDLSILTGADAAEDALEAALQEQIITAATSAMTDPGYDYVLPENFFATVAEKAGVPTIAVESVAALYVRTDIGNTFFGHPNRNGHKTVANAVLATLENNTTGKDIIAGEIENEIKEATSSILYKCNYGEEMAYVALGSTTVAEGGYVDAVAAYVEADKTVNLGKELAYEDQLAYVTENASAIAGADFITYQMDSNEIVKNLLDVVIALNLGDSYAEPDWSKYITVADMTQTADNLKTDMASIKAEIAAYLDADTLAQIHQAEDEILAELSVEVDDSVIEQVEPYVEHLVYSLVAYAVETAKGIEAVKSVNDTAPFVLVGMYNILDGVVVKIENQEIDLGEFFAYVVEVADVYDLIYAIVSENLYFVDVSEAQVDGAVVDLNVLLGMYAEVESLTKILDTNLDMAALKSAYEKLTALTEKINKTYENILAVAGNTANEAGHAYIAGKITDAVIVKDHTPAASVAENRIAATCTTDGSYDEVVYCESCHKELSRENKIIGKAGHLAGDAVVENEVAATCKENGGYDEVTYCVTCEAELSRETKTVDALGHSWDDGVVTKEPTATETGVETYTCTVCGETKTEALPAQGGETCPSGEYTDLDCTAWYHDATDYVIYNKLMQGTSTTDKVWSPDMTITRGMVVTTLYRMAGEPAYTAENVYADLDDNWYTDAMLWATENKILEGYGDGNCGPTDYVTREQMVLFFQRYAAYKGIETEATADLGSYPDVADVSDWATKGMEWAVATGMYKGRVSDNGKDVCLNPKDFGMRTELATLLYRLNTLVLK